MHRCNNLANDENARISVGNAVSLFASNPRNMWKTQAATDTNRPTTFPPFVFTLKLSPVQLPVPFTCAVPLGMVGAVHADPFVPVMIAAILFSASCSVSAAWAVPSSAAIASIAQ